MLTAAEATAADAALTFDRNLPRDERVAAHQQYLAEQRNIRAQFAAYLAATYLPGFNTQVQEAVFDRAYEVGGGFENIEIEYSEIAVIFDLI